MNRTRYRLPAIALVCIVACIALQKSSHGWMLLVLLAGVAASAVELARHYGHFRRIEREWSYWFERLSWKPLSFRVKCVILEEIAQADSFSGSPM
jgi:hypothetical protein